MVNATELQRPDRGTIGGSAGCRDYPMSTHGTEGRVVIREVFHWCATRAQAINRIGLTRYAGVATLATVSISPGESAISIRGFL
jgi:hypothetical protein